jgi:hypothetical protein
MAIPLEPRDSSTINVPVSVPGVVGTGQFCLQFCIADAAGRISEIIESCVNVTNRDQEDDGPGGAGECSDAQFIGSCTIRSCVDIGAFGSTDCWYEVAGQTFNCTAACDCQGAAASAANYAESNC